MYTSIICLISWIGLCLSLMLLIFVSLIFRLQKWLQHRELRVFFQRINTICILSFTICGIFDLIHIWIALSRNMKIIHYESSSLIKSIMICADAFYFIGNITLFLMLSGRLYYSFQNTVFSIQKWILWLMFILVLATTGTMIAYLHNVGEKLISEKQIVITLMCLEIVISLLLSFLFVFKLHQLLMLTSKDDYKYYAKKASRIMSQDLSVSSPMPSQQYSKIKYTPSFKPQTPNSTYTSHNDNSDNNDKVADTQRSLKIAIEQIGSNGKDNCDNHDKHGESQFPPKFSSDVDISSSSVDDNQARHHRREKTLLVLTENMKADLAAAYDDEKYKLGVGYNYNNRNKNKNNNLVDKNKLSISYSPHKQPLLAMTSLPNNMNSNNNERAKTRLSREQIQEIRAQTKARLTAEMPVLLKTISLRPHEKKLLQVMAKYAVLGIIGMCSVIMNMLCFFQSVLHEYV